VAWLVHGGRAGTATGAWRRWRGALLAASVACLVPTLTLDPYSHRPLVLVGVLPLQAVGFGLLLFVLAAQAVESGAGGQAAAERRASWPLRALAFVGISSYSTYLWHWPFAGVLTRRLAVLDGHPAGPLLHLAAFIAVALAVGAVWYRLVEVPALAWRRRWLAGAKRPRELPGGVTAWAGSTPSRRP